MTTPAGVDAWVVTRYDDVRTVLRDPRLSSRNAPSNTWSWTRSSTGRSSPGSILQNDGQAHRRLRAVAGHGVRGEAVEAFRPRIAALVDEHIDAMLAHGGPIDLVEAFALPIPSLVICELLGVPYEDREQFQERSAVLVRDRRRPREVLGGREGLNQLHGRAGAGEAGQAGRRPAVARDHPRRGAGGAPDARRAGLARLHPADRRARDDREHDRAQHPRAAPRTRSARGTAAAARARASPRSRSCCATCRSSSSACSGTRPTTSRPAPPTIKAGDFLVAALSAANRDPEVFETPDELDLTRTARRTWPSASARTSASASNWPASSCRRSSRRLYARIPTLRLAVPFEEIKFKDNTLVYGVQALPVTW